MGEVGGEAGHLAVEEGHGAQDEDHQAVGPPFHIRPCF